jgi:hypothetical protein
MSGAQVDEEVRGYIDAIPAGHRPLFDRLHRLIVSARPDVTVSISYKMPAYRAGDRRVYLAAWKHGISVYGWRKDDDGGFVARHPGLKTSTGTIRLRPEDAAGITDEEFLGLFRGALDGLPQVATIGCRLEGGAAVALLGGILPGFFRFGVQPLGVVRCTVLRDFVQRGGDLLLGGRHEAGHFGHPVPQLGVLLPSTAQYPLKLDRVGHGNLLPIRHETMWSGPLPDNRYPESGGECASPGACPLSAGVERLGSHSQP